MRTLLISSLLPMALPVAANETIAAPAALGLGYGVKVLLALLLVLGVAIVLLTGLRRIQRITSASSGHMKVLGALAVGPREKIVLVSVAGEQLLLGVCSNSISLLSKVDDDSSENVEIEQDAAEMSRSDKKSPFSAQLQSLLRN